MTAEAIAWIAAGAGIMLLCACIVLLRLSINSLQRRIAVLERSHELLVSETRAAFEQWAKIR